MNRGLLTLVAASALAALVSGCRDGSYGSATMSAQSGDTTALLDLNREVQISEGSAASVHVVLKAKDGDTISGSVQSSDPTILQIATTPTDSNRYVFLGVKAGNTEVTLLANGRAVAVVPATVIAPPAFTLPDASVPPIVISDAGIEGGGAASVDAGSDAGGDAGDSG